jgi:hypothetical protein
VVGVRRDPRLGGPVAALLTVALLLLSGCTGSGDVATPTPSKSTDRSPSDNASATASSSPSSPPRSSDPAQPTTFDPDAALRLVRDLAALGPREATSPAYAQAADLLAARLAELGYAVHQQIFTVPAGVSWGVPVPRGRTANVVAVPAGLAPGDPHLVVGAHLDTVPQSPGAEDNASGIAVLVELARLARAGGTRLPVVFVAFAAEEPRSPTDDEHHFGSQAYVRRSAGAEGDARRGMVSLDRVGAAGSVPVCTGGLSPRRVQRELLAAAARVGVPARACENRTSDHWPFEKAGETVARIGGNPSPGYHSSRDLPRLVSRRQLARTGAVIWEWLRG